MIRRVEGMSMMPTYRPGAVVVGTRMLKPRIGSVVVAQLRDREILKRVAHIGPDGYYLLGDNPAQSSDSRTYGWFDKSLVKGVVIGSIVR